MSNSSLEQDQFVNVTHQPSLQFVNVIHQPSTVLLPAQGITLWHMVHEDISSVIISPVPGHFYCGTHDEVVPEKSREGNIMI